MNAVSPVASARMPALLTEMETKDIPAIYRRFADTVGPRHWKQRVAQMKAAIKGNHLLADLLHKENAIAFALDRYSDRIVRYGTLPNDQDVTRFLYPAISFAAQVLSMMELATPVEGERLLKRVQGAMKNPEDMRALRLELATATHFARRGHRLAWPEMVGGGTFDLLVTDLAGGLEVECKSVSDDKGRNVHRREALDFNHLLVGELASIVKNLKIGLSVVLTVPGKLPMQHADRVDLAKRVRRQINIGHSAQFEDGYDIRITEFDAATVGNSRDRDAVRVFIDRVTGTQNREAMLKGNRVGGALAFVVQSAHNDDTIDAMFKKLSNASREQLSGSRPAILIAGFDGIDGDQLRSIAEQDKDPKQPPTALAIKVSKFLSSDHRDHVIGVGFVGSSALLPVVDGVVNSGRTAYYFPKRESPFWREDFSGIFTWRESSQAA